MVACVSLIVTVKAQGPPESPEQTTLVVPIGKNAPDAGLHATVPQPDPVGVENVTTFPQLPGSFVSVLSDGQVSSQVVDEMFTDAVDVLSVLDNSAVELETVAVLETAEPAGAFEFT
jgi:hypothetical protein